MSRGRVIQTPLAVTSRGEIVVNASYALGRGHENLDELLDLLGPRARIFLGIIVPSKAVPEVLQRVDDAAAEIVGRVGVSAIGALGGKASGLSAAGARRGDRDQRAQLHRHPQGRRRQP